MRNRPCFIISHKYVRGYPSFINHYVSNINEFYPDSLIIIVDNNSKHPDDVLGGFIGVDNVVILYNDTEAKFEHGAYLVGLRHILDNNLLDNYDYYVFTQDTYILKNKYDFNELNVNNVLACPISFGSGIQDIDIKALSPHLINLGLFDTSIEYNVNTSIIKPSDYTEILKKKVLHCYCSSYIVHKNKIHELQSYLSKIQMKTRYESELSERYFAWVLFKLNNNTNYQIDFNPYSLYDQRNINPLEPFTHGYFVKRRQVKNEKTLDT